MADFRVSEQRRPKDVRELAKFLSPGFLKNKWGERLVQGVTALLSDVLFDGARAAIQVRSLRSPVFPYDGLDFVGSERMLPRFPGEAHATYKTRLLDAWKIWRQAGTRGGIIHMFTRLGFAVDTVRNSEWNWDNQPQNWSRFWVVMIDHPWQPDGLWQDPGVWDDGGTWDTTATPDEVRAVRNIVRNFKAAHEICPAIIVVLDLSGYINNQPSGGWALPWNRFQGASYWDG